MKKKNLLASIAVAAFMFSACNNSANTESEGTSDTLIEDTIDTATIGQRIDNSIDSLERAGEQAKNDIDAATDEAKADAKSTGQNIKEDLNAAKDDVGGAAKAAGKDIKKAANKVADKTKEGYKDVKESLKKDDKK